MYSCQFLYKQALNGLKSPYAYGGTPCEAWIQPPPVLTTATNPQIFIWGAEETEDGETYMQTAGIRRIERWIEVHVMVADDLNSPTIESDYPSLIEAIEQTMRVYPVVVEQWADPVTGGKSNIMFVGNKITHSYPFVQQLEPQQLVMYRSLLRFQCIEDYRPVENPTYSTVTLGPT